MKRAIVIKTVGDADLASAISEGLTKTVYLTDYKRSKNADAYKVARQRAKIAQYRAAAMARPSTAECVFGAVYTVVSGVGEIITRAGRKAGEIIGKADRLYRWLLVDTHVQLFDLLALMWVAALIGALLGAGWVVPMLAGWM